MARDSEYDKLASKYKRMKDRCAYVEETLREKEKAWAEIEERYKITDKLARDLCEIILSKDNSQAVLGKERTWGDKSTQELLNDTKESYADYCKVRTDVITELQNEAKLHGNEADLLEAAVKDLLQQGGLDKNSTQKAINDILNGKTLTHVINKLIPDPVLASDGTQVSISANEEMDNGEAELYELMAKEGMKDLITNSQVTIKESRRRKEQKTAIREKIAADTKFLGDIEEMSAQIEGGFKWVIVQALGSSGESRTDGIVSAAAEIDMSVKAGKGEASSTFWRDLKELVTAGVVQMESVKTPLSRGRKLYKLTSLGERMYANRFGSEPKVSEMDRVKSEHTTYEHGYGIVEAAELIREMRCYKEVRDFNRKNAIKLDNGREFVPDIAGKKGDGQWEYFEYELGTHKQDALNGFNDKCDKMMKASKLMNFIVPNQPAAGEIREKVDAWLDKRTAFRKGAKIRITTSRILKDHDVRDEDCWLIIYDLDHGKEPVKCPEVFKE